MKLWRCVPVVLALGGCHLVFGVRDFEDTGDARTDGFCVGSAPSLLGEVCAPTQTGPIVAPQVIDTDDDTQCDLILPGVMEACAVVGTTIRVATSMTPHGSRPLVLMARDSITVEAFAIIDASASEAGAPAADLPDCDLPVLDGANGPAAAGGGGGAGGTFATAGGIGGSCSMGTPSAQGGVAVPLRALGSVRGGCRGGRGGQYSTSGGTNAPGGRGGGALYLVAGNIISVEGVITTAGGGGSGGTYAATRGGGGGGGGSGGLIVLDAPRIALGTAAVLLANGGGGGGGADHAGSDATGNGGAGGKAHAALAPPFIAAFGSAGVQNSTGANGAVGDHIGSSPTDSQGGNGCSGGGGGGGVGYIRLFTPTLDDAGASTSPAFVIVNP